MRAGLFVLVVLAAVGSCVCSLTALQAAITNAKDYTYSPPYTYAATYNNELIFPNAGDNAGKWEYTAEYDVVGFTAISPAVTSVWVGDYARWLGALYRQDSGSTVTKIVFDGEDYVWDCDQTELNDTPAACLKGSNWRSLDSALAQDGNWLTLVKAMEQKYNKGLVDSLTVTVHSSTASQDIDFVFTQTQSSDFTLVANGTDIVGGMLEVPVGALLPTIYVRALSAETGSEGTDVKVTCGTANSAATTSDYSDPSNFETNLGSEITMGDISDTLSAIDWDASDTAGNSTRVYCIISQAGDDWDQGDGVSFTLSTVGLHIMVLQQPTSVRVGELFSLTAALVDGNGQIVAGDNVDGSPLVVDAEVSIEVGPGSLSSDSDSDLTSPMTDGIVSWADLVLDAPGLYVLSLTGDNVAQSTGTTIAFEVTAGAVNVASDIELSDGMAGSGGSPVDTSGSAGSQYALSSVGPHTFYLNTSSAVDIPNAAGSITCVEDTDEDYLTIVNPQPFTSSVVEDETTTLGTLTVSVNLIEVDHVVSVTCTGDDDGAVFAGSQTFYFKIDFVEGTGTDDDTIHLKIDQPVLQTLINASASDIIVEDTESVRAVCTAWDDIDMTDNTNSSSIFTVNGTTNSSEFVLLYEADGDELIAANDQFGSYMQNVAINTVGTFYLKCLYTGSSDDDIEPTQYFKRKVVVTGDADIVYLQDPVRETPPLSNQADLLNATATELQLGVAYEFNLFSSLDFTPATETSVVQITCSLYTNLDLTGPSTTMTVSTSGGATGTDPAEADPEESGLGEFTIAELLGSADIAAGDQIGNVAVTVQFTTPGTRYLKCVHEGTDDASVLAVTTDTQWFQHKIFVRGDTNKLQLRDTAKSKTISNQEDLSGEVLEEFLLGETYTFGLFTVDSFTSSDPAEEVRVTCSASTSSDLNGSLSIFTPRTSSEADTATASGPLVLGDTPDTSGEEIAGSTQIGNGTISVAFIGTPNTYYLKCLHTNLDANMTGTSTLQWFQAKILVTGAVDQLYLKDSENNVTLDNEPVITSNVTSVLLGKRYTFGLYSSNRFTSSGGTVQVECSSFTLPSLSESSDVFFVDETESAASVSSGDSETYEYISSSSGMRLQVDSLADGDVINANEQIGSGEIHMEFNDVGTYYIQCKHTGTDDTGLVGASTGAGVTNTSQWFQFAVNVTGDVDVFYLAEDDGIVLDNQDDLEGDVTVLMLDKEYTLGLYSAVEYTAEPDIAQVSCDVYSSSLFVGSPVPIVDVVAKGPGASAGSTAEATNVGTFVLGSAPAQSGTVDAGDQIGTGTLTVKFGVPGDYYLRCKHTGTVDEGLIGNPLVDGLTAVEQWFQHHIRVVGAVDVLRLRHTAANSTTVIRNDNNINDDTQTAVFMLDKEYEMAIFANTTLDADGGEIGVYCVLHDDAALNSPAAEIDVTGHGAASAAFSPDDNGLSEFLLASTVASGQVNAGTQVGDATITIKFTAPGSRYIKCTHGMTTDTGVIGVDTTRTQWFQQKIEVRGYTDVLALKEKTSGLVLSNMADLTGDGYNLLVDKEYEFELIAHAPNGISAPSSGSDDIAVECTLYTMMNLSGSPTDAVDTDSNGTANGDVFSVTTTATSGVAQNGTLGTGSQALIFGETDTYYVQCLHDTTATATNHTGLLALTTTTQWFQFKLTVRGDTNVLKLVDDGGRDVDNQEDLVTATATTFNLGQPYTFQLYMDSADWTVDGTADVAGVTCSFFSGEDFSDLEGFYAGVPTRKLNQVPSIEQDILYVETYTNAAGLTTVNDGGPNHQLALAVNRTDTSGTVSAGTVIQNAGATEASVSVYFLSAGTYFMQCLHNLSTDEALVDIDGSALSSTAQWFQHKIEVVDQHILGLVDSTDPDIKLVHTEDLASASPVDIVIDKTYDFQLTYLGDAEITPDGNLVNVECKTYSSPGMMEDEYVDTVIDVTSGASDSGTFSLEVTAKSQIATDNLLSSTGVGVSFNAPGTYYVKCSVVESTGTDDAKVYRYAPIDSFWQAKVRVTGQNRVLDLREAPFSAVAGSGGANDIRPFARDTGELIPSGTLLSAPLNQSTTLLLLVNKSYSAGNLVQFELTQAPSADVIVDCYSSIPELLADITGIRLPAGSTSLVDVEVPNVTGQQYTEPREVEYRCSPVYSVGNFLSSSIVPFKVYVVPKIRVMAGASDPVAVSGRDLTEGTDITTISPTPEDCKTIDMFEGANLGNNGADLIKLEVAIKADTEPIAITCEDTANTAIYTVTSFTTDSITAIGTIDDFDVAQAGGTNPTTAALIPPNGDSVVSTFRCFVSSTNADENETSNTNFTLNESVYFSMRVNPVTLYFDPAPPTSIIEGESLTVTVKRTDAQTGSYTCTTTTPNILNDDAITPEVFGDPLDLNPSNDINVSTDQDVTITCRPIADTGVVYDSSTTDDEVSFVLTILPQAFVIEAVGGGGLLSLATRTAIAPTENMDVDITGGTTPETTGYITEEQYNGDGNSTLLQISLNFGTLGSAATIQCTPNSDAFQTVVVENFLGEAKPLSVKTSSVADKTYADVTEPDTVEFTCKAVSTTEPITDVVIGKMAAGETSIYKLHVVPIVPQLVLGTAGIAESADGTTKGSTAVLATTDVIQLVEGQSLSNILSIKLTSNPSATFFQTSSDAQWACVAVPDGVIGDSDSDTNRIRPITGLANIAKPIVLSSSAFSTVEVGAAGEQVTLTCTFEYTGEVTVESPAPENIGGVDIGTSVRTRFFIAPKYPVVQLAGEARMLASSFVVGAAGEAALVRSQVEEDAFVALMQADPENDMTEAELREAFTEDAWYSVPVVYVGEAENTTSIRLNTPRVGSASINLGATQDMTCVSDEPDILANIAVPDVSNSNTTAVSIPTPSADALDGPVLVTYTCTYDADVVDDSDQVHITGGETTEESLQFTVVASPVLLEVQNADDAVGLDNQEQTYTDDITGTTETPILVGGSTAAQVGDVFELALNITPEAGSVKVACVSDTPGVLADTQPIEVNSEAFVVVPVPAPSVVTEDILVTYTCQSTEDSALPALGITHEILVVSRKIYAIGGVSDTDGVAYSTGAPGLAADELDFEIIDPNVSPVAGVVDLRPVIVEGQATDEGAIAVVHFPVATTAPVTMQCTSSSPAIADFTATQTASGHSLPLTIPPSTAITERVDVTITCAVQGTESNPTAPVGGYIVGRSTTFTVNLQPLRIVVLDSSDTPITTNPITVSEGVKRTSAFKISLNGVPGISTRVECRAANADVFADGTAAFSVSSTFTADATAVAFDLPASKNVATTTLVRIACALFDPASVPTQSSTATATSTPTTSTTEPVETPEGEATPAVTTAAPTPAPTLNPAVLEPKQTVFFNVTVEAGTLVAKAGDNARNARNIPITAGTVLSSTVVPVIAVRKNNYQDVVTIEAPWKGTDWTLKCTSTNTSVMRTPEQSEYIVSSSQRSVSINLAPAIDIGEVSMKCEPKDATEAGKALLSTSSAATFKLSVVGPAIQILTGSATGSLAGSLVRASDLTPFVAGVDITGSGSLTTTIVLPSGFDVDAETVAIHMRLKAPVSNTALSVSCDSSNTDVLDDLSPISLSTSLTGHGNRNAVMIANMNLPVANSVTSNTTVVYTCAVKCDVTSATLGEAKFDVWVPAPQIFIRASSSTRAEGTVLTLPVSQAVTRLRQVSTVYMGMEDSYTSSVLVYTATPTGGAVPVTCTTSKEWLTAVVTTAEDVPSEELISSAFYAGSAATIHLYSLATAEDTATVTCTLDETQGDYAEGTEFGFSVKAEPVASMLAVAGTRSALFNAVTPVTLTGAIQMENIGRPLRGAVALLSSGSSTTVACMSDRPEVLGHILMNNGTSFELNDSTLSNFEHTLDEMTTFRALQLDDFPVTELSGVFNTNDLEIPTPGGEGTVTYTCSDYIYDSDLGFVLDPYPEVGSTTFSVQVTGRFEGQRPPATRTKATVSIKIKMTFDSPPPREVKEAIFALMSQTVAAELGVLPEDVFVYEDTSRRRLMTVRITDQGSLEATLDSFAENIMFEHQRSKVFFMCYVIFHAVRPQPCSRGPGDGRCVGRPALF